MVLQKEKRQKLYFLFRHFSFSIFPVLVYAGYTAVYRGPDANLYLCLVNNIAGPLRDMIKDPFAVLLFKSHASMG